MRRNKHMPTISLCMIVKNEERFLAGCLESVKDCVDEIIIVDTGSTDDTVKIAKSCGAKVCHHPWENDFSKHRNQSIGYAKSDWILWLDADEALEPGGWRAIREATKDVKLDSYMVTMVCYFDDKTRESWNNAIKLFRNNGVICFQGAVHNQVAGYEQTGFCPVKIYHYGYDFGRSTIKKKFERTSNLLKKAIRENPNNFRHHHDLAVCYSSVGMFEDALEEGHKAIAFYKKNGSKDPNILWTYFVTASSYFNLGRIEDAKSEAQEALKIDPEHIDSYFVLASISSMERDLRGFEKAYYKTVGLIKKYRDQPELLSGLVVNKINEKWRLDLDYGTLLLGGNRQQRAKEYFGMAIDQSKQQLDVYRLVVVKCRRCGYYALAGSYLEDALIAGMDPQIYTFEKALLAKSRGQNAIYKSTIQNLMASTNLQSPELMAAVGTEALEIGDYSKAESLLGMAIDQSYENPRIFTNLALACKYKGRTDKAVSWNLRALEMSENNINALINLGHLYYEQKQWEKASFYYEKAVHLNKDQSDVLFRLSLIALMDQDLKKCVNHCDELMESMNIGKDMIIKSVDDMATIYHEIGEAFLANGKQGLYKEAANLAKTLSIEN